MSALLFTLVATTACFDDPNGDRAGGGGGGGGINFPDASTNLALRQSGEVLVVETKFDGHPELGSGPLVVIGPIQAEEDKVEASYEEAPGSPFACKVFELTAEQYANQGVNVGSFQFTIDGGPTFPPCNYVDGVTGWACSGANGTGGDIRGVDAKAGLFSITDPKLTFGQDEVGRLVKIAGASQADNNGVFPVVAVDGDNTIHYQNPAAVEELAMAGNYSTHAGFGPSFASDPIGDDYSVTVALTAGGEGKLEDFSTNIEFGNSFSLDTASQALISNLPMDGSEFTIGCDGEGGDCGAAMATALNIEATDGVIEPTLQLNGEEGGLPPPATKYVRVFCLLLIGRVTVPAEASAYLASSGATRVRAFFVRAESTEEIQKDGEVTLIMGHGIGGFTDPK